MLRSEDVIYTSKLGQTTYTITTMPMTKGVEVWGVIMDCIGTGLVDAKIDINPTELKENPLSILEKDIGIEKIGAGLLKSFGSPRVPWAINQMLSSLCVDGKEMNQTLIDAHFAGNYGALARVVQASVVLNYSSFFDRLAGKSQGSQISEANQDQK